MGTRDDNGYSGSLDQLAELPAVAEVVWSIVSRFHASKDAACLFFVAPTAHAGTTTIAAAAAIALARQQQEPVCLIEANVEHPGLARLLDLNPAGLTEMIEGDGDPTAFVQSVPDRPRLDVLTAGARRELAAGQFTATRWRTILDSISATHRYVLVDAPPILEHVKSRLMLQSSDGAVLVLHTNATAREAADRAHRMVTEAGVPMLGLVFNTYRTGRWLARARRGEGAVNERVARNGASAVELAIAGTPLAAVEPNPHVGASPDVPPHRKLALALKHVHGFHSGSEAEHRREVDLLERRIAKLTASLTETEAKLREILALKDVDGGVSSVYREVQGLSLEDQTRAQKSALLEKIFEANQELQQAISRRTKGPSSHGFEFRIATSGDA